MTQILIREGEHIEKALRRFKRMVEAAGILKDARQREFYLKPSIRKKEKMRAAVKRRRRAAARAGL